MEVVSCMTQSRIWPPGSLSGPGYTGFILCNQLSPPQGYSYVNTSFDQRRKRTPLWSLRWENSGEELWWLILGPVSTLWVRREGMERRLLAAEIDGSRKTKLTTEREKGCLKGNDGRSGLLWNTGRSSFNGRHLRGRYWPCTHAAALVLLLF